MKTPLQQLIDRLSTLYDLNLLEPEYRSGLVDAIAEAKLLLPIEKSHILHAWQDGAEGIINQSPNSYFKQIYNLEVED